MHMSSFSLVSPTSHVPRRGCFRATRSRAPIRRTQQSRAASSSLEDGDYVPVVDISLSRVTQVCAPGADHGPLPLPNAESDTTACICRASVLAVGLLARCSEACSLHRRAKAEEKARPLY